MSPQRENFNRYLSDYRVGATPGSGVRAWYTGWLYHKTHDDDALVPAPMKLESSGARDRSATGCIAFQLIDVERPVQREVSVVSETSGHC
jgi:hypothetical protein